MVDERCVNNIEASQIMQLEDVINGMYDWVRVIDRENNVIYVNKAMAEGLGKNAAGMKCFEAIGRAQPCSNCVSRKAVFDGVAHIKEEVIGDSIFSVMSSPVKDQNGNVIAAVEVLRNITQIKGMEERILQQNIKFQEDLSLAKKLQYNMLPKKFTNNDLDFSYIYKPCESLGGDFVDVFAIDNTHTGIYIADVSGHGVSASMLTVFLRSTINKKQLSPAVALKKLYKEFNSSDLSSELYITVFYAVIDLMNNRLTYSNAGHNVCPVLFNSSSYNILTSSGVPISNWVDEPVYQAESVPFKAGDRLFLCTDGVVDIKNLSGEHYGEERLLKALLGNCANSSGTLDAILGSIDNFAGANCVEHILDDLTIAIVERK